MSTFPQQPGSSTPTAWHSLRFRLPLLISALVIAVMAVFLGAAYREVEASLVRAASERARGAAEQVVTLLARSTGQGGGQLRRAAEDADVRRYLEDPTVGSREAARKVLASLAGTGPRRTTLWSATGSPVLEIEVSAPADSSTARRTLPESTRPTRAGVGPFQATREGIFVDTVAEVNEESSSNTVAPALLGYLAVRSTLSINPPGILSRMVGNDAVIEVGNRAGGVWTDFSDVVPAPPVDLTRDAVTEYRAADRQMRLGAARGIVGTPWAVWVEFPRAGVVAPARTFLNRMIVLGGLFAIVGALLVWVMTGRVTTPLSDMTLAAEAIAGGDYSRRVPGERRDEIGRLGTTFNVMTGQVQEAHRRLETRVQERTRELNEALATLSKQSEARERYLASIVESSDDAIIGKTPDGIVQSWNPGAEHLYGYTAREMIDRPISVLVPPDRSNDVPEVLNLIGSGESIRHYETVRLRKDGARLDVSLTVSPMRDAAGHVVGASTVARDITERKRAQEALRVSEERYRHLFAQSPDPVLLYDAATLELLDVNEAAIQQYGYSHDEFTGLTVNEIRPAGDVPALLEPAARPLQPFVGVRRHRKKDGSVFHVELRVSPAFDAEGRAVRLAAVRDISERLSLEDRLRQAQKMEAIGRLAGGVAHDFNNLLTAILGYANLVSDGLSENDARRLDVQEIIKAGDRAAALTRQLLAFSRKQVLQTTLVDLNALIGNTSQMLRRLIGEDIQLVTALAADLAPVRADAGQLEQIVINLAVNARDAMPGGGRLSIETANVELDDSYALQHVVVRPGRYVMLAVSDSGVGMDEDTKRRLFEPFFTTKEQGKGTGLGLSTVYGIVKQSEGYIWVYSEPGKGAAFKVYLPRAEGAADAAGKLVPKALASGGSEKVLVVEDEEAVRYLTRVLLERSGYRVLDAANPREAEAVFNEQTESIDLLITDVVMPGSSGPALFKQLAQRQPGLKVLYMSGYTDDTIVREGRLDTGGAFMQKPFTGDGLMRKVREVLDR